MKTYRLRVTFEPDNDGWDGWSACCPALEDNGAFTWAQTWEEAHNQIVRTLEIVTGNMIESGLTIPEEPEDAATPDEGQCFVNIQPKLKSASKKTGPMRIYQYRVVIVPDEDRWFAYCPVLESKGAATWGHTRDEALKNIREVLPMVLETLSELGETIPEEPEEGAMVLEESVAIQL